MKHNKKTGNPIYDSVVWVKPRWDADKVKVKVSLEVDWNELFELCAKKAVRNRSLRTTQFKGTLKASVKLVGES